MSLPFKKTGAGFAFLCAVVLLVAGCAVNKPTETRPTSVYSPMPVTNTLDESKPANDASSTNSLMVRPLSRRERPQRLQQARERNLYKPETELSHYDKAFIASVQQHWYDLLDRSARPEITNGIVTLDFRLLADGSISDMKVLKTTVNAEMTAECKHAIMDVAPFQPWPPSMRSQMNKDYREIQFDFYFDPEHGTFPLRGRP